MGCRRRPLLSMGKALSLVYSVTERKEVTGENEKDVFWDPSLPPPLPSAGPFLVSDRLPSALRNICLTLAGFPGLKSN